MNYMIGTGYYGDKPEHATFFGTWMQNTLRHTKAVKESIVVVNAASKPVSSLGGTWLNMRRNYGHVKQMPKDEKYGGWWTGFMLAAMHAYHHGCDFIYKEQDCLAFGPWVDRLYGDQRSTGAKVLVGKFDHKYKVEQSLVLVMRKAIPELIRLYLNIDATDMALRPELKFLRIMKRYPKFMQFMSMGCGRNRPIPYQAPCFYVQKLTAHELRNLQTQGLLF